MINYNYLILDNNTVELRETGVTLENDAPLIRQDVHPDGRAWESREEAEQWALEFIAKAWMPLEETTTEEATPVVE